MRSSMQLMILLMIVYSSSAIEGIDGIHLSPSQVASVCSEEQLSITCYSNLSHVLRWMVILPERSGTYSRTVPDIGSVPSLPIPFADRTITVNFSRPSTSPLISTLTIDSAITELNGTGITCSTANASEMAIVHVIDAQRAFLEVRETPSFLEYNVIVNLEWTQVLLASYNITSVFPQTTVTLINKTRAQLVVPYNTAYNVSVTAYLCGQNVTTDIQLFYSAKCGYPLQKLQSSSNISNSVISMGPRFPITEGASINFSCPPQYVLSGPNSTVCTIYGLWDPDPKVVNCVKACSPPLPPSNGYISSYIRTSEGYTWIKFVCQNDSSTEEEPTISLCSVEGRWSPDPEEFCSKSTVPRSQIILQVTIASSVYILISSFLFLVICVICGYYNLKQKRTIQSLTGHTDIYNPTSDSVATVTTSELQDTTLQDQDLELTENVCYDTSTYRPRAP